MARIRTVKPEFWTDEAISECSVSARLLFIGMWNFADDNGNLERSSKQLKAKVFPYDSLDCEPLVVELIRNNLVIEYEAATKKLIHIANFLKHQRINRPTPASIPEYEDSLKTHTPLTEPSPPEGKGREGKGREEEQAPKPSPVSRKSNTKKTPKPPASLGEVVEYARVRGTSTEFAKTFFDYFEAGSWHDKDGNPVLSWKQKFVTWQSREKQNQPATAPRGQNLSGGGTPMRDRP